jgi:hypothetical protein
MQPPTIPADLRLRTHLLVWGARVLVIGAGGLLALLAYLNTLAALYPAAPELAAARFHRLTLLVAGVLVVLTSGVAGLCSFLAMRILHTGHYPPPGMHVIRETPLRTGRPARRVAFLLWALAVVVFLCGMGLSVALWWAARLPVGAAHRPLRAVALAVEQVRAAVSPGLRRS